MDNMVPAFNLSSVARMVYLNLSASDSEELNSIILSYIDCSQ